jgi:hypothetical protein
VKGTTTTSIASGAAGETKWRTGNWCCMGATQEEDKKKSAIQASYFLDSRLTQLVSMILLGSSPKSYQRALHMASSQADLHSTRE